MRRVSFALLGAAAFSVVSAGIASAADLPPRPAPIPPPAVAPVVVPVFTWSGFYIGANGGYGTGQKCWTLPLVAADEGCHDTTGALAGGQIGFNWQMGSFVFGLEAQGDWANLKGSNVSLFDPTFTNESRVNAIGLFTARVGFAANNFLLYAKGGAAVVSDKYDFTGATFGSASETRWGWTVGGGVEFGFTPNWSLAAEYNYVDTGKRDVTFDTNDVETIKQNIHLVTARVNYRFGFGGFAGMYLGARLQKYVPQKFIKLMLGIMITSLAVKYITQYFA
jgi:outer membrane immunogenic protein